MIGSIVVKASMLRRHEITKDMMSPPRKNMMLCSVVPIRDEIGCSMALQSHDKREIKSPVCAASKKAMSCRIKPSKSLFLVRKESLLETIRKQSDRTDPKQPDAMLTKT
mmetsp:Transcript_7438/g.19109  ORF Transcript_7438/g.19109 Transcript_7438/m.19109 type:complete len:109 (-) Transcript_7438:245-571(-)